MIKFLLATALLVLSACGGIKPNALDPVKAKNFSKQMTAMWTPNHCRTNAARGESYSDFFTLEVGNHFIYTSKTYKGLNCNSTPLQNQVEGYYTIMTIGSDTQAIISWQSNHHYENGDLISMKTTATLSNASSLVPSNNLSLQIMELTIMQNGAAFTVPLEEVKSYPDILLDRAN